MKHLFSKATRSPIHRLQQRQQVVEDGPSDIRAPTPADVMRYRYHHGTNIGSVFILERWITGSLYSGETNGTSELAAVEGWVEKFGIEKTREMFERHWRGYVSDGDIDWLRDVAKCTTIRLPIGYFTLGPAYCTHTPFEKVAAVYQNAWAAVKALVCRCHHRGIGVLIDLHGLPGGANGNDHSGTNSGKAEFWTSMTSRNLATTCLCFVAQQTRTIEGVVGIQIVNEAEHNAKGMYNWYTSVVTKLSRIDPTILIYISDGWDLKRAVSWSQNKNSLRNTCSYNPVVVDTHLYWCFSDADKTKSPQQITNEVRTALSEIEDRDVGSVIDHGAAQAVVGEYSCVLSEETWSRRQTSDSRDQLVRSFGNAQTQRFQHRAAGCFFWTYRMDWMPGGEWGFRAMNECRAISPPICLTLSITDTRTRIINAHAQQEQRKRSTVAIHSRYWDANPSPEPWRFEAGWDVGFEDAMAFFAMRGSSGFGGGDKIGLLDLWCLKRIKESGQKGATVWEFEQGLRQGIKDFYEAVGV